MTKIESFKRLPKDMANFYTLQTWKGHNTILYRDFNALPHALPYIFYEIYLVLSYLQGFTSLYRQYF